MTGRSGTAGNIVAGGASTMNKISGRFGDLLVDTSEERLCFGLVVSAELKTSIHAHRRHARLDVTIRNQTPWNIPRAS
jgi:hypothetical protein